MLLTLPLKLFCAGELVLFRGDPLQTIFHFATTGMYNFQVVWPIDISPEVIAEMFNAIHWKMETVMSNIKSQQKNGNQAW